MNAAADDKPREFVNHFLNALRQQRESSPEEFRWADFPPVQDLSISERLKVLETIPADQIPKFGPSLTSIALPDDSPKLEPLFAARRRLIDEILQNSGARLTLRDAVLNPQTVRDSEDLNGELRRRTGILEHGSLGQFRELLLSVSIDSRIYQRLLKRELNDNEGKRDAYLRRLTELQVARHELVTEYFSAILVLSLEFYFRVPRPEILLSGFLGFCGALERYDRTFPYPFQKYAPFWIRQRAVNATLGIRGLTAEEIRLFHEMREHRKAANNPKMTVEEMAQHVGLEEDHLTQIVRKASRQELHHFSIPCHPLTPEIVGVPVEPLPQGWMIETDISHVWCL
ncbi:MAG: hypothetical protein KDA80_16730 [Planctomycetaceae bacterium]|nr:hypothetical protein [Planctomycetaceae bacterium]